MIENTFIFLPRIGKKKESSIWNQGIKNWDDFLSKEIKGISKSSKSYYDRQLHIARLALHENNSSYFADIQETWRLYDYFREDTVFLDIESSGSSLNSYLTVIGLYDGIDTRTMVRDNLDKSGLKKELEKFKLIVTFNGKSFDIPFLNKKYPGLMPKVPIIDLRHLCARIGLNGGLKEIEEKLGIERKNDLVKRFYGGDSIKLWRMYKASGDEYYLKLLVEYNEEDCINLKKITEHVVSILKKNIYSSYPMLV